MPESIEKPTSQIESSPDDGVLKSIKKTIGSIADDIKKGVFSILKSSWKLIKDTIKEIAPVPFPVQKTSKAETKATPTKINPQPELPATETQENTPTNDTKEDTQTSQAA
jgi:hypothetical protein